MRGQINEVTEAIEESNISLIEYKNNIRDLEWEVFDKTQDMMSDIQAESEFLNNLLSNEKMFDDDTGAITKEGQASLGLHALSYNSYMKQADEYAKELEQIERELANDRYNVDLLERKQELLDAQRDLIESAEDEKQAIKDLVSDGYDAFLDSLEKIIDKRKELLDATKDLYDYEKNVSEQTKEIANLEKQLAGLGSDDSEETRATVQKLKVQLEEARTELEETEYDKYISDQEQMLDALYDEAEEWINDRLDNLELVIQEVVDATNENAATIKETLENKADSVGYELTDAMDRIWSGKGNKVSIYDGDFESLTTTNNILEEIRRYVAFMSEDPLHEKPIKDNFKLIDGSTLIGVDQLKKFMQTPLQNTIVSSVRDGMKNIPSTVSKINKGNIKNDITLNLELPNVKNTDD